MTDLDADREAYAHHQAACRKLAALVEELSRETRYDEALRIVLEMREYESLALMQAAVLSGRGSI